jgi:serine/threonine-protein kinase
MSPEQARGQPVDKRTDIWAFGCVLYETLTGRRAFEGAVVALTLSNVLQREPDWGALPGTAPAWLTSILQRCLAKDPRQRVRDMGDVRLALDGALELAGPPSQRSPLPRASWQHPGSVVAMVLGSAAMAAFATRIVTRPAPAGPAPVTRTSVVVPPAHVPSNFGYRGIAISPSGTHFVYVANGQLYLRALDELEARPLAGTEESQAANPFFSPDGQWIGFESNRDDALVKVALGGGAPVRLATTAGNINGATWGEDDTIVYAEDGRGILRVSAAGGQPEVLVAVEAPVRVQQPQVLPGGRAILYTRCAYLGCTTAGTWDASEIVVEDLATRESTVVVQRGADARYLRSGHLVYAQGNTLMAVRFDAAARSARGGPVPLVEGVNRAGSGNANADVSRNGTLVYLAGSNEFPRNLVWVDRKGREEVIRAEPRYYYTPRLSPDGKRIVVYVNDANSDLWVWDLERATLTRLTDMPSTELYGVWTRDGGRVIFNSSHEGTRALYWRASDGIGAVERLLQSPKPLWPMSLTPDGGRLVYVQGDYFSGEADLHVLTLDGERRSEPLIVTEFNESEAELSPDGRWLAYQSNASGRHEVYVQPFPTVDQRRWPISTAGGGEPLWSRDGRELFYRTEAGVMAVSVSTTSGFAAGTPSPVVSGQYERGIRSYDISRDGTRFLMLKAAAGTEARSGPAGSRHIVVVQNWFAVLNARVAVP